ncbi:MAG: VTC domain-containing protein [Deltaproteobacteria bacterium]|nr:VTC domain-containing protein [Deltaproteobacteria bacterium]
MTQEAPFETKKDPKPYDLEWVQKDPFGPLEHELKFEVDRFRVEAMATHLEVLCQRDPQFPANTVVSLYYDSPDLHFLRDKLDSHYLKTKVRLRWYEAAPGNQQSPVAKAPAFLEVKRRVGSLRRKARVPTNLDGRQLARLPRDAPELLLAPERLRQPGAHPGGSLEPFLLVRYHRRRFVEPLTGARVCLDTAIQAAPARVPGPRLTGPFAAATGMPIPERLDLAVLEVKGSSSTLPPPLVHLVQGGCFKSSFSKYGLCYERLAGAAA